MGNRIIEIVELGKPQSIIQREGEPITELIHTHILIQELNEQLLLYNVVGQSEQYCDCDKPTLGNNVWTCGCGKLFNRKDKQQYCLQKVCKVH